MSNKAYLFIGNSTKPTKEQSENISPITLDNVAKWPIESARKHGYQVFLGYNRAYPEKLSCVNNPDIVFYDSHTYRSLFAFKDNWIAFKNLMQLLKEHPEIEFIHCNTPLGGIMGRICGYLRGVKTVIYTAHGFHFYKGAPLFNRTILKWAEQLMAHWTDAIITMNQEDYEAAQKMHIRNHGKAYFVPGVGVDSKSFEGITVDRAAIRRSIGVPEDAVMAIAMGDIVPRKNYKTAIEAVAKTNRPQLHYVICGVGTHVEELKQLAKDLGIESQIHFLGFRKDIKELALSSDLFLFSSLQEGLPRSTMEAMFAGLPCVISKVRGHVDLIEDEKGGLLVAPTYIEGFAKALQRVVDDKEFCEDCSHYVKQRIKEFDVEVVRQRIDEIFDDILKDK